MLELTPFVFPHSFPFVPYETVKISGDLLALMRASQNRLVVLNGLRVPKLKVFDNRMMKREFVRLSAKIAAGLNGNPR